MVQPPGGGCKQKLTQGLRTDTCYKKRGHIIYRYTTLKKHVYEGLLFGRHLPIHLQTLVMQDQ